MKIRYWLSVLPAPICGVFTSKYTFWIDDKLLDEVKKGMGECRILVSAGFYEQYKKKKFVKREDLQVLADSGGFQFYFLTEGRQREFYEHREEMYTFQLRTGDYVMGGDIPAGQELDEGQMRKYAAMTRDNMELQFKLGCTQDRFFNIMHGISPYTMNIWYDYVKQFKNIGWAVGAKVTGAVGTIFQMLYLMEKGELDAGKMVHFFAMSGRENIWQVFWVFDQMGLGDKLILSSDSSSFSLGRFGGLFYDGEIVRYDEIRSGKKKVVMYDGSTITDVPKLVGKALGYEYTLTSVKWFLKWLKEEVLDKYDKNSPEVLEVVRQAGLDTIIKWWKVGGTETAWCKMQENVGRKSNTRLVDRLFILEGGKGKKM